MPSSKSGRVRPSDIAADTKRHFIPMVKAHYGDMWPPVSTLYPAPLDQLPLSRHCMSISPPSFRVEMGDPVSRAIFYGMAETDASGARGGPRIRVPFICAANERRPGGDWETCCAGYEERLCRRSNLFATLSSPDSASPTDNHFPIPLKGGILSEHVVVCRGPHEHYEKLDRWYDLPIVSVAPTRWPKLRNHGSEYSFVQERDMMRDKLRAALRICAHAGYDRVVIGDFGLGNGFRNPPQALAEMWRDIFLFDPDLRGLFAYVVFVFEDPEQNTSSLILDEMAKKASSSSRHRSDVSSSSSSSASSSASRIHTRTLTDLEIFEQVFDRREIERVVSSPDPRYGFDMIVG